MADLSWTQKFNESFRSSASTQMKSYEQDFQQVKTTVDKLDREIQYIDRLLARQGMTRSSSRSRVGFDRLPSLLSNLKKDRARNDKLIEKDKREIEKDLKDLIDKNNSAHALFQSTEVNGYVDQLVSNTKLLSSFQEQSTVGKELDIFINSLSKVLRTHGIKVFSNTDLLLS